MTTISNSDDTIFSIDVIERIGELEEIEAQDLTEEDAQELATLKALAGEAEGYASDWTHGETLIRDSYFKEYAEQLAEDTGDIDKNAKWPHTCIDWERAAKELQMDYIAVDFDGVTYWIS